MNTGWKMLQKLKIRLVATNVVLLTVVLAAVFAVAYFLLESQLVYQERTTLNKVASGEIIKPLDYYEPIEIEFDDGFDSEYEYYIENYTEFMIESEDDYLPDSSARMFYIKIYMDYEIISLSSSIIIKEEDVYELIATVDKIDKAYSEIDLSEAIKLSFMVAERPGVRIYVFIERATREETMTAYIYTANIALIVSVVCAFAVSVFMAGKAIKPVRESIERQEKFIADA